MNVHSEMTMIHSVDIDHRHNHEHEHLSEEVSSSICFAGQKINKSFHGKRCSCFPRMNSCGYEDDWLLELERSGSFREKFFIEKFLVLVDLVLVVI